MAIAAVRDLGVLNRPAFWQQLQVEFIIAAPCNGAQIVTCALGLLRRIVVRRVRVVERIQVQVGPGVVPRRGSMFIANFVRFVVNCETRPITGRVGIRLFIRAGLYVVLYAAATGRVLQRAPINPFCGCEGIVCVGVGDIVLLVVYVFFGARDSVFCFECFSICFRFGNADVRVELSMSIEPPRFQAVGRRLQVVALVRTGDEDDVYERVCLFHGNGIAQLSNPYGGDFGQFTFVIFRFRLGEWVYANAD